MIIQTSAIRMSSSSELKTHHEKEETLQQWAGGLDGGQESPAVLLEISAQAKSFALQSESTVSQTAATEKDLDLSISEKDKTKIRLLEAFMEKLTGKKLKIYVMDRLQVSGNRPEMPAAPASAVSPAARRTGWGIRYDYRESYNEQETMSFAAGGTVRTADGREINFSLQMNMSRQFASQQEIHFRAGDAAIDPLVVNFADIAPQLTEQNFVFDLDADGTAEQVSFLKPGSGFLAMDKNGDQRINDGSELFGPGTGDGFAELRQFDGDGNNWIDENDPIYDQLRIWTRDEQGGDQLLLLGEKGIGAVYLGNLQTPFNIKDAANQTLATVRSSGVFLRENGTAGTVQQIDLQA